MVYSVGVQFLYRSLASQIMVFKVRNARAVIGRRNSNESEFKRVIEMYVKSLIEA